MPKRKSKTPIYSAYVQEAQIDHIMRFGYYVMQYSEHHYRVQDAVDFWPSTGKWVDRKGYPDEAKGVGFDALIERLTKNYPLEGCNANEC